MRECQCGYTCGTDAALARHLERALTPQCQALGGGVSSDDGDGSLALLQAARSGDAARVRQGLQQTMHSPRPLEEAVRGGHVAVTSDILAHCRRQRYPRPLDPVNVVCNVLNWAVAAALPPMVAMLSEHRHLDALRNGPLELWHRLSLLLGKSGSSAVDDDGPFTAAALI